MPGVLFAKAWHATGHVPKEMYLEQGLFTQEDWDACKLMPDAADMIEVLGAENAEEPSVADLISNGEAKRRRVVWLVQSKHPSQEMAIMPGSLVFPVEKKLANHVWYKAQNPKKEVKQWSTIVFSRRTGKEISSQLLQKHTVLQACGRRRLKEEVPKRTSKDRLLIRTLYYCAVTYCTPNFPWVGVAPSFVSGAFLYHCAPRLLPYHALSDHEACNCYNKTIGGCVIYVSKQLFCLIEGLTAYYYCIWHLNVRYLQIGDCTYSNCTILPHLKDL